MVATSSVLHLHRVRRLGARRVPKASTRGLRCFEVDGPIARAQPTQKDDPLLLSSGLAGNFRRSDQNHWRKNTTEAIALATLTSCRVGVRNPSGVEPGWSPALSHFWP